MRRTLEQEDQIWREYTLLFGEDAIPDSRLIGVEAMDSLIDLMADAIESGVPITSNESGEAQIGDEMKVPGTNI